MKMIPVFLAEDISNLVEGVLDDMPVRAWRHNGSVWFLAVNASYERKVAVVKIDGRSINLDLPPLGYVLRPATGF